MTVWDFPKLAEQAAYDLRTFYEREYGCKMGMQSGCDVHPTNCKWWPRVFAVWQGRRKP